jgi:formamidopyrimidine-DNA glycosylase
MPELPEVECLSRAVRETLVGTTIRDLQFFRADLRDPIPTDELRATLVGQPVVDVFRRSKYLLLRSPRGLAVIHLGMTGNLLRRSSPQPELPHTHAIFTYEGPQGDVGYLHFVDPRRFGRLGCLEGDSDFEEHVFFRSLGPEPLAGAAKDLGTYLFEKSRKRKVPVKNFIMDAKVLVGVGNIYASESLFRSGISPKRRAGSVTLERYERLASAIQETLEAAIAAGGTSFRDFKNTSGDPGYFSIHLNVYGRDGEPCPSCQKKLVTIRQGGRSTYYCPFCQK